MLISNVKCQFKMNSFDIRFNTNKQKEHLLHEDVLEVNYLIGNYSSLSISINFPFVSKIKSLFLPSIFISAS